MALALEQTFAAALQGHSDADPVIRILGCEIRIELATEAHVKGDQFVPSIEADLIVDKGLPRRGNAPMICNSISKNMFYLTKIL